MGDAERDWRDYWSEVEPLQSAQLEDALRQVGKTTMGVPIGVEHLALILKAIREALELSRQDHVVDLGCGNGLVSEGIASEVASVLGLDVSPRLVADANRFRAHETLRFAVGDFTDPALLADWPGTEEVGPVWKWYAYEVIQHLSAEELGLFLKTVASRVRSENSGPGESLRLFLGSIPDRARIRDFYDTPERWALYERNRAAGVEQIGTWWKQEDLQALAEASGFTCRILPQDPSLYTAHYRFHALLTIGGNNHAGHA